MIETMNWEWPICIDLWVAGIAGGGFFAAFIVNMLTGNKYESLLKVATWIGVPMVGIGAIMLIVDLGNPLRFWHLMVRFLPLSPMSIGVWVLTLWGICGAALLVLWLAESDVGGFAALRGFVPMKRFLCWINFILSPLLIAYTGVLLCNSSMPLWTSVFLPAVFVTSAIFTGTAATRLVAILAGKEVPKEFSKATIILVVLQAVALVGLAATAPAGVFLVGSLSTLFWVGVVVIGMIIPFLVDLKAAMPAGLVAVSMLCVLVGGLVLRAVVVIGGQM